MASAPPQIKVRLITEADITAAIDLLTRGYGTPRSGGVDRPRSFWEGVFSCLKRRQLPVGDFPRYGYVIDSGGKLVGIMLLIFSAIWEHDIAKIRCNGSSLYVDPDFRLYAPLLIKKIVSYKGVTGLNLTPAKHTLRMIEALGYAKYCDGTFVAIPLLSRAPKSNAIHIIDVHMESEIPFDPRERDLLLEHAGYGCESIWCITPERAYPFVFRVRHVKHVPCAQLVYCSSIEDFVRFARPIGLYLARSTKRFLVVLDANGPIPGLVGKYFAGRVVRYFIGPDRPRLGDLAYTEISIFDV